MNVTDTAKVLALVSAVDRRVVDEATVAAWHDVIGDLPVEDCLEAVRVHRRESTEYLVPAHVRRRVLAWRAERVARAGDPLPGVDPDDVAAYQAARIEARARVAAGEEARLIGGR